MTKLYCLSLLPIHKPIYIFHYFLSLFEFGPFMYYKYNIFFYLFNSKYLHFDKSTLNISNFIIIFHN